MKNILLLFLFAFPAFSFAQKTAFNCQQNTRIKKQSIGSRELIFDYKNNKLQKKSYADGGGFTENFSYKSPTELVITKIVEKDIISTAHVTLNAKGCFLKYESDELTTIYEYAEDGFLMNSITIYNSSSPSSSVFYTYQNGNCIKATTFIDNMINFTDFYTYDEKKLAKADYLNEQHYPAMLGNYSKNLVKSIKRVYSNKLVDMYQYTYTLNNHNFVISLTERTADYEGKLTKKQLKFEYICL